MDPNSDEYCLSVLKTTSSIDITLTDFISSEVSMFTYCEDMKGNAKYRNLGGLGG